MEEEKVDEHSEKVSTIVSSVPPKTSSSCTPNCMRLAYHTTSAGSASALLISPASSAL